MQLVVKHGNNIKRLEALMLKIERRGGFALSSKLYSNILKRGELKGLTWWLLDFLTKNEKAMQYEPLGFSYYA